MKLHLSEPLYYYSIHDIIPQMMLPQKLIENDWLHRKYIQQECSDVKKVQFKNDDYYINDFVFIRSFYLFPLKENSSEEKSNLIVFLKNIIDKGKYIVNIFEIPYYYMEAEMQNASLIYGYNDNTMMFHIVLCSLDNVVMYIDIPYLEYIDSVQKKYKAYEDGYFRFNTFEYNKYFNIEINNELK